ncbi:MAG: protein kinase [Deltaproteobacteria bacterium]|nr:protein kinase [Deltaproteobacteria bacterium]
MTSTDGINTTLSDKTTDGLVAGRYRIEELLAKGGMGAVFRVTDQSTGKRVALKRLLTEASASPRVLALFQLEYHTLARLNHPGIIHVFDYGIDVGGPFYTMELLEGKDLRDLAPLPFRRACLYLRDVASSLALLHTHRFLHRDLSPRNIRCIDDEHCKLLDFGSMATFGVCREIAGTPPFVPPEALRNAPLDHRADIYSLGALAYWILSRRHAHRAKSLEELPISWSSPPARLSSFAVDIPSALDELVMSMISIDPLMRPSSAAEVIERLNWIADLEKQEDVEAMRGYFLSSKLVGRSKELTRLRQQIDRAIQGKGGSLLIEANPGIGRTRLLTELSLQAQLRGARVLSVDAQAQRGPYGTIRSLVLALLEAAPTVARTTLAPHVSLLGHIFPQLDPPQLMALPDDPVEGRAMIQRALHDWFLQVAESRTLVLLIDNVHRADENSIALITVLAHKAPETNLMIVTTRVYAARESATEAHHRALRSASRRLRLHRLSEGDIAELVRSLFGSVPNIERVSKRFYEITFGNPQHCMELARHFVDRNVIRYTDGIWVLPTEIGGDELPRNAVQAIQTRIQDISPAARRLVEALCVYRGRIPVELCLALFGTEERQAVFSALEELTALGVLVSSGEGYSFAQESFREGLLHAMDHGLRQNAHRRLGETLVALGSDELEDRIETGWQLLQGGDAARGADLLAKTASKLALNGIALATAVPALEAALEVYEKQKRSKSICFRLRSIIVNSSYLFDYRLADRYGDQTVEPLYHYSGLSLAERFSVVLGRRLGLYLGIACAALKHLLTARNKRGPNPIRALAYFLLSLPPLLGVRALGLDVNNVNRLFAYVKPLLGFGEKHSARAIYLICDAVRLQVLGRESEQRQACIKGVELIRDQNACKQLNRHQRNSMLSGLLFSLGINESYREQSRALEIAAELDAVGSNQARLFADQVRLMHHMTRGERELAEAQRRKVEMRAVRGGVTWQVEFWFAPIEAYIRFLEHDVVNQKRMVELMVRLSRQMASLEPYLILVRAAYLYHRDRELEAIELTERIIDKFKPRQSIGWGLCYYLLASCLTNTGAFARVKRLCSDALAQLRPEDLEYGTMYLGIELILAQAQAGLGNRAEANAQIDRLVARCSKGANPLHLAYIHEAGLKVALSGWDQSAFHHHAQEMRRWSREIRNPAMLSECEKLAGQGQQVGLLPQQLPDAQDDDIVTAIAVPRPDTLIERILSEAVDQKERAARALHLIVDRSNGTSGYLYLLQNGKAVLAASLNITEAVEGIDDRVQDYIDTWLKADTRELSDRFRTYETGISDVRSSFISSTERIRIILLTTSDQGEDAVIGAAVLPVDDGSLVHLRRSFTEAIARILRQGGEDDR